MSLPVSGEDRLKVEKLVPGPDLETDPLARRTVDEEHPVAKDAVDEIGRGGVQGDDLDREPERRLEPRLQPMRHVPEPRLGGRVEQDAEVDVAPGPLLAPDPAAKQPGRDERPGLLGEERSKRLGESRLDHAGIVGCSSGSLSAVALHGVTASSVTRVMAMRGST